MFDDTIPPIRTTRILYAAVFARAHRNTTPHNGRCLNESHLCTLGSGGVTQVSASSLSGFPIGHAMVSQSVFPYPPSSAQTTHWSNTLVSQILVEHSP